MKLSYALIRKLLSRELDISPVPVKLRSKCAKAIAIYADSADNDELLYLTTNPEDKADNILCITSENVPQWHISVQPGGELAALGRVLALAQSFLSWLNRCTVLAEVEHDINGLLDEFTRILKTCWTIVDRKYRFIAVKPPLDGWDGYYKRGMEAMPQQAIEELYSANPRFDETFALHGLQRYAECVFDGRIVYYRNIFSGTFYIGRILILLPPDTDADAALPLLEHMCSLADDCCRYRFLSGGKSLARRGRSELLHRLMDSEHLDARRVGELLSGSGWAADDSYEVLCFVSNGHFHSEQTLEYYAVGIEMQFESCTVVRCGMRLVCLHDLTRETDSGFRRKLTDYIRENLFRVGVSNPFSPVTQAKRICRQAEDALRAGERTRPEIWRCDFADFTAECTMQLLLESYRAEDLCPRSLRTVMQNDAAHPGSELLPTLRAYYECAFNAQRAAERLFIHRTTFFYRLNKIKKLAQFDFDDAAGTGQLLLAFAALRETDELK